MMRIGKRILALLLCIVICMSLLPASALAEEGTIETTEQAGVITAAKEGNIFFSEAETAEESGTIRNDADFESADVSAYILQEGGLFAPNSQLSSEQKKGAKDAGREVYLEEAEALLYAAAAGWDGSTDSITVDISEISCPTSDIWDIWINVLNDNPDLFYMGYMTYDSSDGIVTSVTLVVNTEDYSFQDVEVFRNKTNRILTGVESSWTDEQKALYVHDYLVTHCEYDLTYSNYSAYDAIISESCVCQGYALAYCFLLQKCGVECEIVTSWALNHAWNLVTIGSAQYYVDCTWDDPVANASETLYQDFCRHVNFLRSRDGLISTRHNSTDWVDGDGNDVYNNVKTGTAYESAWWNSCNSAIPHVGNKWAYFQGGDSGVYIHDYSTGKNSRLFTLSGKWYVWGSTSSYYTGYSHLAAYGKQFYISTADKIYRFTSDGKQEVFYSLTKNELAQGYIYGIRMEKSTLYYRLYTDEKSGDFVAEHSLALGEVIPEIITSGVCGDDLTWTLDDLYTLTISGTGDMWDFYGKGPEWHNWCKAITSLVIQPGATSVGNNAFYECTSLVSVTIPDSVIRIGDDAFTFCESVPCIVIPDSVTSIGDLAFQDCAGLKEVTLSNSLVYIGYGAFLACTALKNITIPAGVTSTGDYTFQGCTGLKEVTLSNSLVSIGDGAFCECTALKNITIPASVTSIGYSAFGECTALTRFLFNGSAPTFAESAFSGVTATAHYPAEDATWTDDVCQDYGGTITWRAIVNTLRIYGKSRYETCLAIAEKLRELKGGSFENVVVACGTNFPDALAGSYLAVVKNAPILLVSDSVAETISSYIATNMNTDGTIYILGSEAAVSAKVEQVLSATGRKIERLAGKDRYLTNIAILEEAGVPDGSEVLVSIGTNFADSLSASSSGRPILMVDKNKLSAAQEEYLEALKEKGCRFTIIGSPAAVSTAVEAKLSNYSASPVERVAGPTRYQTSIAVAEHAFGNPESVVLAVGNNFPDGLSAGPLAYELGAPVVLTLAGQTAAAEAYAADLTIKNGYAVGGSNVLSDGAVMSIFGLLSPGEIEEYTLN